jgi:hypothetical protein
VILRVHAAGSQQQERETAENDFPHVVEAG